MEMYFNTSNVTIQRKSTAKILIYKLISIHLMLLFNNLYFQKKYRRKRISIHLMLLFNGLARGTLSQVERFQYI